MLINQFVSPIAIDCAETGNLGMVYHVYYVLQLNISDHL